MISEGNLSSDLILFGKRNEKLLANVYYLFVSALLNLILNTTKFGRQTKNLNFIIHIRQ